MARRTVTSPSSTSSRLPSAAGSTRIVATPPPDGAKPWRGQASSTRAPMRASSGANTSIRKSSEGAIGLWVPPVMRAANGRTAVSAAGSSVCTTSAAEPAEPMSISSASTISGPGANDSRIEPTSSPLTLAPLCSAAARTQARCCLRRPGLARPARIFSMVNGRPVITESASALRKI